MKSGFKNIWKISVIAIAIGLILATIGLILGANRHIYADTSGLHVVDSKGPIEIKDLKLNKFTDIDIESDVFDIEFIESNDYGIEIKYYENIEKPTYSLEDGTLKISTAAKNISNFRFFNLDFNFDIINDQSIKIYLPKNTNLNNISIKSNVGSIDISNFTSQNLNIESDIGDVTINDAKLDKLNAKLDTGKLNIENCEITDGKIKTGIGDVKGTNLKSSGLNIDCDTSSIKLQGDLQGDTEISSNIGSITLETSNDKSFYNYDISTDIGSIKLDDEKQGSKITNSDVNSNNNLNLFTDTGSISVKFNVD